MAAERDLWGGGADPGGGREKQREDREDRERRFRQEISVAFASLTERHSVFPLDLCLFSRI